MTTVKELIEHLSTLPEDDKILLECNHSNKELHISRDVNHYPGMLMIECDECN